MPKNITQYDLLISCPGDITDEIGIVEEVVASFNQQFTNSLGISILPRHWSKSSYPQSDGKPQELLNEQFVKDCDAAVAIFWTRFGTPTDEYKSGSEEEIQIMLDSGKQVFLYFCEKPIKPGYDSEQYKLVEAFKERLHRIKNKIDYINTIHFYKETNTSLSAASLKWSPIATVSSMDLLKGSLIKISEEIKNIITLFVEKYNFTLSNDFFDVGELQEDFAANMLSTLHGGGTVLKGTASEKRKYEYIYAVKEEIEDYILWESIEKTYSNLNIAKLLVENSGNSFDEDIDIEILIPVSLLIPHYKMPVPEFTVLDSFDKKYNFSDLFSIQQTDKYFDYDSSVKNKRFTTMPVEPVFKNEETWIEKKYKSEINKLFSYEIFERKDETIIKLHVDYIKQHTSIAFPTPIFLDMEAKIDNIKYRIISKNNPDIRNGTLKVIPSFEKR